MTISRNDRPTYLNFDGFNPDEYRFSRGGNNNLGGGRVIGRDGERMFIDLRTDRGRAAASEDTPGASQSSLTSTLVDAGTGAAVGIARGVIDDNPQPEPARLDTSVLALFPSKDDKKTIGVIVPDPAPPAPEPIAEFDGLKKITAAPGTKPATPGTFIDPAAPLLDPTTDANREARENRVYDLLFDGNPVTRFGAGLGYGSFTPQEAMALQFYVAQHRERLRELRTLHGEDALRLAATEIVEFLEANLGNPLPSQPYINAQINAALNLTLHPDYYIIHDRQHAIYNELFRPIHNNIENTLLLNDTISPEARSALRDHMVYHIDVYLLAAESLFSPEEIQGLVFELRELLEQQDGPVDRETFDAHANAVINHYLAELDQTRVPVISPLQQAALERFDQANEQAQRILEEANQPFADRTATIREAIGQAAADGDVYLQIALSQLLPPELGYALAPGAVVDPATSTALLNHLRNMRPDEAAGVLETLEADPGNVAPEILDALRRAVDPRSSFSSEDKTTYDNYIRAGSFNEPQFRNISRLNPDRSDREIMNFLALRNQGITLPGYVTREPEPPQPPGESNFGPVGRPTQEELDALQQQLEVESAEIYEELDSGDTVLSPSEIEEKLDRAGIQGMVADAIMLNPGSIRVLRDSEGEIAGVAAAGIRNTNPFDNRPAAFYVQDILRVGEMRGVTLPLLQSLYREAEALNLPLALRPLNDRVAAYYESLGGQRTESGEMIWRDMPRPVGQ